MYSNDYQLIALSILKIYSLVFTCTCKAVFSVLVGDWRTSKGSNKDKKWTRHICMCTVLCSTDNIFRKPSWIWKSFSPTSYTMPCFEITTAYKEKYLYFHLPLYPLYLSTVAAIFLKHMFQKNGSFVYMLTVEEVAATLYKVHLQLKSNSIHHFHLQHK